MSLAGQEYIGPYRLLNVVKTGQNSQVWAAVNDANQEKYAIKVLLIDASKDKEHVRYMRHEFAVGRTLEHPRVIRIFDQQLIDGRPYLVMELFPWPNMKDLLLRGVDRIGWLVPKIIEQAADGLAYLNLKGWIHRDVKPDNFLVNEEGDVKLIDFALAEKAKGSLARMFAGKSKIQGTRSYMSPEQIRGLPLDQRSDVYSFGCTIYHLLAGTPPYTGVTSNELLTKHLRAPVPNLEAHNRNVTPELAALFRNMLAKRPQDRPASLSDFLAEFRGLKPFKIPPRPPAETQDRQAAQK